MSAPASAIPHNQHAPAQECGRKSIMFFDQHPHVQGGQRVLVEAVITASASGHRVTVAFPHGGTLETMLREMFGDSVSFENIPMSRMASEKKTLKYILSSVLLFKAIWHLRQAMAAADWIYINAPRLYLPVTLAMVGLKRPKRLLHVHLRHTRKQQWLIRLLARLPKTAHVIVPSSFIQHDLAACKTHCISNVLSKNFTALPFREPVHGDRLRVALIGVIRPEKGHAALLAAAAEAGCVEIHMFGDRHAEFTGYADQLRAQYPQAYWHGAVADIPEALAEAGIHMVVAPSTAAESFGLAAIEGAACSCFVAVSNAGALPDIAQTLGAPVFHDHASLVRILRDVQGMSTEDFQQACRNQWQRARRVYAPEVFHNQIAALF